MDADKSSNRPPGGLPLPDETPIEQQLQQRIGQLAEAEQRLGAVVHNVDGIITISEGPDKGSEFIVRLPASVSLTGEAGAACGAANPPPSGDARRHRVLIVDDNTAVAEVLAEIITRWHHETRVSHTGEAALKLAKTYQPDVVLLDIGLPGISGYDVAEQLRRQPEFSRTLLVAITGHGQEEDRRRSRAAGCNYHLIKPVSPEECEVLAMPAVAG